MGNDRAPKPVFLNDGKGRFERSGTLGSGIAPTRSLTVADIDGDGDMDVLVTNRGKQNAIYLKRDAPRTAPLPTMSISLLLLPFLFPTGPAPVRQDATPAILSLRERARWIDRVTLARLEQLAPRLMREEGIDTWVLVAREYNEDPVVLSMLPATWMSARRRTILVLHDPGGDAGLERLAVARYDLGLLFEGVWDPAQEPDQWAALAELLSQRDPDRIALDFSPTFALAALVARFPRCWFLPCTPSQAAKRR